MSEPALRNVLAQVELNIRLFPHPGLWLDKLLPQQFSQREPGGEDAYRKHFEAATTIPIAPSYKKFYERWKKTLKTAGVHVAEATTLGRLVIGLGAESVLENAITLHRTYGVPVIPGSALKGLTAAYARKRLEDKAWHVKTDQRGKIVYMGEAYKALFGDTTSAGYVTFFDALYVPGSATGDRPLVLDVVTVHHKDYYQGKDSPPADWDGPNPVPFVSVRGGVKFLVVLAGPDEWVEAAFQILTLALAEEGVGAKTNSGYGRMVLGKPIPYRESEPGEDFRQKIEKASNINQQFVDLFTEWESLDVPEDVKRDLAQLLLRKAEEANLPKSWAKKAKKEKTRKKALRNLERYKTLLEAAGREPVA